MESFALSPQCTLDPDPEFFLRKCTFCLFYLELGPRSRSILNPRAGKQQHPPASHLEVWERGSLQGSQVQDIPRTLCTLHTLRGLQLSLRVKG